MFDKEEVAKAVVRALGRKKGIDTEEITGVDFKECKETQYDILAQELRKHLDMTAIDRSQEEVVKEAEEK